MRTIWMAPKIAQKLSGSSSTNFTHPRSDSDASERWERRR